VCKKDALLQKAQRRTHQGKRCLKQQAVDESEAAEPPEKRCRTAPTAAPAAPTQAPEVSEWEEHQRKKARTEEASENSSGKTAKTKVCEVQEVNDVLILHANMDGYQTHAIDIEAEIALLEREPDIVLLNETKLDE